MGVARMDVERSVLFIVDVQTKLLADIHEAERLVERCSFMTQVAVKLGLPIVLTEQVKRVFGPTHEDIERFLPTDLPIFEKSRFSGCIEPVDARLRELGRPTVIVVGMEAHICIMQTTLDLLDRGYAVFLVTDAISGGESDQIEPAFRRMVQAGAVLTGAVSAAYELMGDGKHPAFKGCLDLVKVVRSSAKASIG